MVAVIFGKALERVCASMVSDVIDYFTGDPGTNPRELEGTLTVRNNSLYTASLALCITCDLCDYSKSVGWYNFDPGVERSQQVPIPSCGMEVIAYAESSNEGKWAGDIPMYVLDPGSFLIYDARTRAPRLQAESGNGSLQVVNGWSVGIMDPNLSLALN
jgi:hypothetical protein